MTQVSRTKFLQHTRLSDLAQNTLDDITCIHDSHRDVMHLTKSQRACLRKSSPTSVSPPALLSHSPLRCGFYFMALDNPNVSLQVPLRGVGWLAHAHKCTQTWHCVFTGPAAVKAETNCGRGQNTSYLALRAEKQTTDNLKTKKNKNKSSVLQLFHKRKHAC